jgi:hypothetical protein
MLGFFCCAEAAEATKTSAQASALAIEMRFIFIVWLCFETLGVTVRRAG